MRSIIEKNIKLEEEIKKLKWKEKKHLRLAKEKKSLILKLQKDKHKG